MLNAMIMPLYFTIGVIQRGMELLSGIVIQTQLLCGERPLVLKLFCILHHWKALSLCRLFISFKDQLAF